MPRLKMRRNASFFVNRSSSCGRETSYLMLLFLLFSSLCFPVVRPQDVQDSSDCGGSYDIKKEGHRLEAIVYKRINVLFPMDCAVQCFGEFCCRSANFRKSPFQDGKENCELLHALAKEKPEKLKRNDNYDYLEVGREEPYNCLCLPCINGGNCSGISKKCSCSPGYNGTQCENDIDECISNLCDTNSKCKDGINSYTCECNEGFSGDGNSCTDIDECISNPCHTNATCQNAIGSFTCKCNEGFTGDGTSCTDIDECISNPCHTNATCQNAIGSFTCKCNEGFTGDGTSCIVGYSSCSDVLQKKSNTKNGFYRIKNSNGNYTETYCQMTSLSGCSGGGWTLVMKADGRKETFSYTSSYWQNKLSYNPAGGLSGFDGQETKLPTYWSTSFKEICVGMKVGNDLKFQSISYLASSLYDLIADGKYRATNLGRQTWKSLISGSSLQYNCDKEGFNVVGTYAYTERARIGVIGNGENDCKTPDSYVGFGGLSSAVRHWCINGAEVINTCGNRVACTAGDNGLKEIRAMGYIFVR